MIRTIPKTPSDHANHMIEFVTYGRIEGMKEALLQVYANEDIANARIVVARLIADEEEALAAFQKAPTPKRSKP